MSEMKIIAPAVHGWRGEPVIPGDKSISHRSVMLAGLGSTPVHIKNFLHAADCLSTVGVMRALGVRVEFPADGELVVSFMTRFTVRHSLEITGLRLAFIKI